MRVVRWEAMLLVDITFFPFLYLLSLPRLAAGFSAGSLRLVRDIFEVLINTSGIGPKMSLGILSSFSIGDFATAVLNKDLEALTRIPGIGKKTAERLVIELKDKMERFSFRQPEALTKISDAARQRIREAVAALEALDCKPYVASRAVAKAYKIMGEDASLESLIKEALKHR